MAVRQEMINGFGVCHGGVVFAFADSAFAFACNTAGQRDGEHREQHHLPGGGPRRATCSLAEAEQESEQPASGYYRVRVTSEDGTVVALFRGTVYQTDREHDVGRRWE